MYFYDDFKNCLFSLDPDLEIDEKDPIQQSWNCGYLKISV